MGLFSGAKKCHYCSKDSTGVVMVASGKTVPVCKTHGASMGGKRRPR